MRYKKYYLKLIQSIVIFGIVIAMPLAVRASVDISTSGCFNRTTNEITNTYTLRMQAPACTITLSNNGTATDIPIILIENIDPDFVTVDNFDTASGLIKTDNTLQFSKTLSADSSATIVVAPWYEYTDDYYFVAISDSQAKGTIDVNPVFETIISQVSTVNPVFYTNSGDLVQGSSSETTMREMYEAVLGALDESTAPMYPIAGNHDYGAGLDVFEDYFGIDDYSFSFANTKFVGLSTSGSSSKGTVDDESLAWLANELDDDEPEYIIPFFHHPLVRPDWTNNEYCCFLDTAERNELAGVIDQNNNVFMTVNGHSHGYDYRFIDSADVSTITNGFYQLITGGAGGSLANDDQYHHFSLVHVTPEGIEHTVVKKNDFETLVEYTNNDGSRDMASAEVTNDADTELPYLRLKFKLASAAMQYLVYDSAGNYIDNVYNHTFDDYTVIYADIDVPANSETIYTVQAATAIHKNTINTINSVGEVTYETRPMGISTALEFTALPGKKTTQISEITWNGEDNSYYKAWKEVPQTKKINTTYSIQDLPANRLFEISVNGKFYDRLVTTGKGKLSFTYTPNKSTRNFEIEMLPTINPDAVVYVPNSEGNPQVRRFNGSGNNLTNWFALNESVSGAYHTAIADVDGDAKHEIIISSGLESGGTVAVYTENGERLAQIKPFGNNYVGGVMVYHGDLTGADSEELVLVPQNGVFQIKVYRYKANSQKLIRLSSTKPFGANYAESANLAIGDVSGNEKSEILMVSNDDETAKIKAYKLTNSKKLHQLASKKMSQSYSNAAISIGEMGKTNRVRILVYLSDVRNQRDQALVYSMTNKGRFKKQAHTWLDSAIDGRINVLAGDIDGIHEDHIVLYSENRPDLTVYRVTKRGKLKERFTKHPFGDDYHGGLDVAFMDANNDWDLELVTGQRAEGSRIKVWNYNKKKNILKKLSGWKGYGDGFIGGVSLGK